MRLYLIPMFFSILILDQINFDSKKAFDSIVEQCSFGPRYPGSKGHEEFKDYLGDFLKATNPDTLILYKHEINHPYNDKEIYLSVAINF